MSFNGLRRRLKTLNGMLFAVIGGSAMLVALIGGLLTVQSLENAAAEAATRLAIEEGVRAEILTMQDTLKAFHGANDAGDGDAAQDKAKDEADSHIDYVYLWRDGRLAPFRNIDRTKGDKPALMEAIAACLARIASSRGGAGVSRHQNVSPIAAPDWESVNGTTLSEGENFYAIALADLPAGDAGADGQTGGLLVGVQDIDADWVLRVASHAGNVPLSFASAGAQGPHELIPTRGAATPLDIAFGADRPGDRFVGRFGPLLVLFALLFCGLFVESTRRIARDLSQSEERARRLASHDPLSGLPNRLMFAATLEAAMAGVATRSERHALICFDLDRFKEINDSHGHPIGDQLIVAVAGRIGGVLRPGDMLARLGGDEFAILGLNIESQADAERYAQRVREAFDAPFDLSGRRISATASIGVALAPDHATSAFELTQLADIALYRSKSEGRNRACFFEAQFGEELRRRRVIERDLSAAIDEDRLGVAYQPIYDTDARRVVCVETLLRWSHPVLGNLPPPLVVAIAEERGLIAPLGEWVLRRACRDAAEWRDLRVAVNVSPIQFRQRDFVAQVAAVLHETSFDPSRLELELTEGVIISDTEQAAEAMSALRALGVRMALDDFGAGYSSFTYLHRLPFDKIKIDRSLLESSEMKRDNTVLIESVVRLGRSLGLTVTAEGVETVAQMRLLQGFGCPELQGFLFAKPMPARDLSRTPRNNRSGTIATASTARREVTRQKGRRAELKLKRTFVQRRFHEK